MSWVVVVKPPDDHPAEVRIFGPFASKLRADALCAAVTEAVDQLDADVDDTLGYAWVKWLESPSGDRELTEALARLWAIKGER